MSGNHYPHIPPPINMNPVNSPNKPKNYFTSPPPISYQWPVNQPNEFENREKYMETQLTASCDIDTNANVNEVIDDGPYPPPGLRRLVTGQTVSFDDGPVSPLFDRANKVADVHQKETDSLSADMNQFPPKGRAEKEHDFTIVQNYENNSENISEEKNAVSESFVQKSSSDNLSLNQEDLYGHQDQREIVRKLSTGNSEVPPLSFGIPKDFTSKPPFRRNSLVENQELVDSDCVSLERGTVPGAQSTPNDDQPSRPFSNANSSSYYYGLQNRLDNEEDTEETAHFTDSDKKMPSRRMVLGHNSNTIPGPRQKASKLSQNSDYFSTRSNILMDQGASNRYKDDRQFEDKSRRGGGNLHPKDKDSVNGTYEKNRKKPMYDRRDRRVIVSDEEDYDDSVGRAYDDSPDRELHSYHDKHYRTSPRRMDKRMPRRDRESSFTQSQDESYYDDDEDDYNSYRNQRKYRERRYNKEPNYKQFNDSYYRKDRQHYRERRDEYYNRYEEESYYGNGRNSRPSSRSGSEYYGNLRYCSGPQYYEYLDHRYLLHVRMSKTEMEYWSKIREIDPKKYMYWFKDKFPKEYAEWYSRHVIGKVVQSSGTFQADRRGSGHSGQSSVNNDTLSVNEEKLLDMNTIQEMRNSPAKFTAPHVKGIFNALGQLIVINPCSPQDGFPADISLYQLLPADKDPDYKEFMKLTGPFIVGETHVNTVSDFVKYHASAASSLSEKLLYLLIDLIIKLRGVTDGIAISELLMDHYREHQKSSKNHPKEDKAGNNYSAASEAEIIEKYTSLLLQGNKSEALDCAINNKLWGHAFLLASKMGDKHYSRVLAKFDGSIPTNNPLKTLYQLYSNQVPQAVTACGDDKWGDWKPHLAMILSNPTNDNEFNKTAIITLGDSLAHKDVYAAHFCYLAAQTDFSLPNKVSTKYTLLSLPNNADLGVNVSNHAILLTQAYEFAKRLQRKDFTISALLPYKYLLATRLTNFGKISVALQYLESIALDVIENPTDPELMYNVLELSEKLKYSDSKPLVADSSLDKQWLITLREMVNQNNTTADIPQPLEFADRYAPPKEIPYPDPLHSQPLTTVPQQFALQGQPRLLSLASANVSAPPPQSPHQQPLFIQQPTLSNQSMKLPSSGLPSVPQQQQHFATETRSGHPPAPPQPWENGAFAQDQKQSLSADYGYNAQDPFNAQSLTNDSLDTNDNANHQTHMGESYDQMGNRVEEQNNYYGQWDQPQQQPVSISTHSSFSYFDLEDSNKPQGNENARNQNDENRSRPPVSKSAEKPNSKESPSEHANNSGGGWLGGIFGKLSLRPKNEMKLPDDKNPSIVWNEEKKRWVDVNEQDDEGTSSIRPPPKASELGSFKPAAIGQPMQPLEPSSGPAASFPGEYNKMPMSLGSNNMYKLSRGKGMKSNYVNVLSQNTMPSNPSGPPKNVMDPYFNNQVPANMKFFAPTSNDGNSGGLGDMPPNSKSLENIPQNRGPPNPNMPVFYNPAQYNSLG